MSEISARKADHIRLALEGDVGFRKTSLFECVELVHNALPELDFADIDLSVRVLGKRLRAPLLIAGMTGGTAEAGRVNRELAAIAEARGYAFGLGSQRAMLKDSSLADTFQVRACAPTTLLLGNLGMVQARALASRELTALVEQTGVDALCIHLNPAMELIQATGDRDFSGGEALFARLTAELDVPVIAKETGCGLSHPVAARLYAAGVRHVDVSGAGGTSWVAVETARAEGAQRSLGERFWDWGIPTAASVTWVARQGFSTICATGGLSDGLEAAKAIALGATVAGIARPVLKVLGAGGADAVIEYLDRVELELRTAMLLLGARRLSDLRTVPRVIHGVLRDWIAAA